MDNIELYKKRVESSGGVRIDRLEKNKIDTFKRALKRSYNSEAVKIKGEEEQFRALITGIPTRPQIEAREISTLKEHGCEVGDIIHWVRDDSYWIVSYHDSTERALFQGSMKKAIYELQWKDPKSNKIYTSMACAKGQEQTIISSGVKHSIFFDEFTDSLYLIVPSATEGSELLKRYFEIMVNGRKWHIEVANDLTNPKLIFLQLLERPRDRFEDTDEIVGGGDLHEFKITSSLDSLEEVVLDTSIEVKPLVFRDGQRLLEEEYIITGKDCEIEDNNVIFNLLSEEAMVTIYFTNLEEVVSYNLRVVEDEVDEIIVERIIGSNTIRALTTNKFAFEKSINGEPVLTNGSWEIDSKYFELDYSNREEISLKAKNKTGETKIKYSYINAEDEAVEIEFKITVVPLFGGS